ncbi:MAG: HYR domain-containing protein, partial [Chitinophagales bacterium]
MNFNLIRNTFLSLSLLLTQVNGFSQAASISASPSSVSVNGCTSPSVAFSGSFSATTTATAFTFNGGTLPAGWSSSPFTVSSTTCPGQNSPDNSPYFWATTTSGGVRFVQTNGLNVALGGSINFYIRYAGDEGAGCEDPDAPDEEVYLQYSTNGGGSWTTIFDGWDTSPTKSFPWYNWYSQNISIPVGARTSSTLFRWYQPTNSGDDFDNWGLEDVEILANIPVTVNSWNWSFGDGGTATGQNVSHNFPNVQGNNTYTVTLTTNTTVGNFSTSTNYSVSINDGIPPVITSCPSNTVVTADATNCSAVVNYAIPTATDACSTPSITRTSGLASGSSFPVGVTNVVHRATDAAGNTATCGFTVTVNDVTAPSFFSNAGFTTPYSMSNQTVGTSTGSATPGFCDGFLTWQHPYAFDNCGFGTLRYAISGATVVGSTAFLSGASITQAFNEGVSTFTYTVTDAAGNAATYSFTVTVEDDVDPVISATNQTYNHTLLGSACTELVTFTRPAITALTGDCNPVTMSQLVVSGPDLALMNPHPINPATGGGSVTALFPAGTTVIRYSWVDSDGNSASVDYSIVVTDSQVPTAACKNITVELGGSSPGTYTLNPNDVNDGSVDNCPLGSTLTVNPSVYTCTNIGTSNYVLTITDASGNTATATCQITVQDNTTPVVVCPASVTVGTNGSCTAAVTMNPISASDNCSNPMLSATWVVTGATTTSGTGLTASGTFNLGASVITYTATYGSTSATCSATVTVQDDDAPTPIACPSNITVTGNIAPGCSFTLGTPPAGWTWNGPIAFSDNCGVNFTPAGQPSHTQNFGVGPNLITIVGEDAAGNEGICQFTVTVVDSQDPAAVCQNLSRDLSATSPGSVTVLATEMENGSSDNCFFDLVYTIKKGTNPADPFSSSLDFGCLETGVNTITFRAFEDGGARFGTATCTVTISDVTPPTAVCPLQVSYDLNTIGTGNVTAISVMSTSTDNCSTNLDGISRSATGPFTAAIAIGCADVFNNFTAYLHYSDPSGNTNSCFTEVVVNDITAPTITCPADMTVDTDAGVCTAAVNYPAPVTTDECSAVTVTVEMGPGFGGTFSLGTTTVELKATDASGNFSTCSFDVTVEDNEDPMFAADMAGTTPYAQVDATVGTSTGTATAGNLCDGVFTWSHPYLLDNCSLGASSFTMTGATTSASAPFVAGASQSVTLNLGTTFFSYALSDAAGNSIVYNFSVDVEDDEAPKLPTTTISRTFNAFTNGTDCSRVIPFDRPDVTGVVDCGSFTMTETIISGPDPFVLTPPAVAPFNTATGGGAVLTAQFPRGITVVEYAWIDNVGNKASVTYTFNVVDNVLPVAVCRNLTKSLSSTVPGTYLLNTFDADNGSSDNCTEGTMLSIISPASVEYTCANIGTSNYTLQITDATGNTSVATCTITIVDNAAPNLACPAAVTVGTDAGICTTNYSLAPLTA